MSSSPESRRPYVDWARGIAVLIMIEAHTLDAWTRSADRDSAAFRNLTILGGFAAPLFLWLAGVAVVLSMERKAERCGSRKDAAAANVRRGFEIFLLAFLFRVQAFILTPGGPLVAILRVDILNVMGPAIAATAVAWWIAPSPVRASLVCAAIATALAVLTPLVREAAWVDALPPFLQWYMRPAGEHTNFTLFPWAAFVFAGAAIGELLARPWRNAREPRVLTGIGAAGAALVAVGFYTSTLPPLYRMSSFWTSSPTYFAIRVGAVMMALWVLFAASGLAVWRPTPFRVIERFGKRSLLIYWIHVELVYGVATVAIHGRLPLWGTVACYAAFAGLMYCTTILADRIQRSVTQSRYACGI